LGKRGCELYDWYFGYLWVNEVDRIVNEWFMCFWGVYVMGWNMFGLICGDWDDEWIGWWGFELFYYVLVFVLIYYCYDLI